MSDTPVKHGSQDKNKMSDAGLNNFGSRLECGFKLLETTKMNKTEAIEWETNQFNRKIENLKSLPDIDGFDCHGGVFSEAHIGKNIYGIEELYSNLHNLKDTIGEYKLVSYWIPYSGLVMVHYKFGKTNVKFSLYSDDEPAIIRILSNGKCKVEEEVSKKVVCGI